MAELEIRKANEGDVDRIAELETLCFSDPWTPEMIWRDVAGNALSTYLVGEIEGVIVAYVGYWLIWDECQINNVAVAPDHRRQGYAVKLMQKVMMDCIRQGIKDFTLEVRTHNEEAIGLYKSLGFMEEGIRKNYYGKDQDALLMRYKVLEK